MSGLELDRYLPYRLSVASNAVSRLVARAYEDRFGLSIPQWRLIAVLAEDGAAAQGALVARTRMDKVGVSRAAQGLVRRHLVFREPGGDGRSHRLALTDAGRELHAEIAPLALRLEAELLQVFSPDEVARIEQALRRLEAAADRLWQDNMQSRSVTTK